MPSANRASVSFVRRPIFRGAALLWMWLTVIFAPVGATLHVMSHLAPPPAWSAVAGHIADARPDGKGLALDRHGERLGNPHHDAAAHCHVCDEWQFLNHALPSAPPAVDTASSTIAAATPLPVAHLAADMPWILPRAPPTRRLSFNA